MQPQLKRARRPGVELLEPRVVLANLTATHLFVIDGEGQSIAPPIVGEYLRFRAEWDSSDLSVNNVYRVRLTLDGVSQEQTFNGAAGQGVSQRAYFEGWFAGIGSHTVTFVVDGANNVAETSESDNQVTQTFTSAAPNLNQRLSAPTGGTQGRDWTITSYPDHNADPTAADYRGGPFAREGATGADFTLANAERMDQGVPVFAVASGTVLSIDGSHIDRPLRPGVDAGRAGVGNNEVIIAHGSGWVSVYNGLFRNSITVREGDTVQAGQMIALVGASGDANDAQLNVQLYHSHSADIGGSWASLVPVDPWMASAVYWQSPAVYQGDMAPQVMDSGISEGQFLETDFNERPSELRKVSTLRPITIWNWVRFSHLHVGDKIDFQWIRPDGNVAAAYGTSQVAGPNDVVWPRFARSLDAGAWSGFPGTWKAQVKLNGVVVTTTLFEVVTGTGQPTIRVSEASTFARETVLNGRTTPSLLPDTPLGIAGAPLTFWVQNLGSAPLALGSPKLPRGVSLATAFPVAIASGSSAAFQLRLDGSTLGQVFGQVRFTTNDSDQGLFGFDVAGRVIGTPVAGTPTVGFSTLAAAAQAGAVRRIDPAVAIGDGDALSFAGAVLMAEVVSGADNFDCLGIASVGDGPGQVSLRGSAIYYQGQLVGTVTGGTGTPLEVQFSGGASVMAASAVARAITYTNMASVARTAPRYVRMQVIDDQGNKSLPDYLTIVYDGSLRASIVASASGTTTTESGGSVDVTFVLMTAPTWPVTIRASSSNTAEGRTSPASVTFDASNWWRSQVITVLGQDDLVVDGAVGYTVRFAIETRDPQYERFVITDLALLNIDNDNPGGGGGGGGGGGTQPIAGFAFDVADVWVNEGTPKVSLIVKRTDNLASSARVRVYTHEGTAKGGVDFVAYSSLLSFVSGERQKTVAISIINDRLVEGDEGFEVVLGQPTGALLAEPSVVRVHIRDDDVVPTIPPPRVVKMTPVTTGSGKSRMLTAVRIVFSDAMQATAAKRTPFRVVAFGADGKPWTADDVRLSIKRVSYQQKSRTTMLTLAKPLKAGALALWVNGAGLRSWASVLLDGDGDGKPSGDYRGVLKWK